MTIDLRDFACYEAAVADFTLDLPEFFNVAEVLGYHASSERPAIHCTGGRSRLETMTFGALAEAAARVGSALRSIGVDRGGRVGIALASTPEAAIAELATMRIGAVAASMRGGAHDAVWGQQLALVRPDVVVCESAAADEFRAIAPEACQVVSADRGQWSAWCAGRRATQLGTTRCLADLLSVGSADDPIERTRATDPAFITFTSGSMGATKAVVLPHSSFIAGIPAFQMYTNLAPQPGDVFFTSLGWATSGGLRTLAFPAWYFGFPAVSAAGPMDGRAVARVLTGLGVTAALVMPQVLRDLGQHGDDILQHDWSALRTIAYAGEAIGRDLHDWLEEKLGIVVNPYYGATEIAYVASTCRAWFPSARGAVGRRVPGRELTVLDEDSLLAAAPGTPGMLAVRRSDPGLGLGYLRADAPDPSFDQASATDEFFLTHDLGVMSAAGELRYLGRSGQLVRSAAGELVAPTEVEDAVLSISSVREAAAVQTSEDPAGAVCVFVSLADTQTAPLAVAEGAAAAVAARFPDTLWLSRVVVLGDLPKTAGTSKINRRLAAEALRTGRPAPLATVVLTNPVADHR